MNKSEELLNIIEESFKLPDNTMMETLNQFIINSLLMVPQFHLFHLQTRSYSEHEALGEFYESLKPLVDKLAENSIGIGIILTIAEEHDYKLQNYEFSKVISILESYGHTISGINAIGVQPVSVVLDEISGLVASTLYKLNNLR